MTVVVTNIYVQKGDRLQEKNKNIKWLLKVWQDYELQESLQCSLALAFGWWWATVSSHNFQTTLCAPFMGLLSSWKRRVSLRGQTMPAKCFQQHNKATGSPHFSFNLPPISIYVHIPANTTSSQQHPLQHLYISVQQKCVTRLCNGLQEESGSGLICAKTLALSCSSGWECKVEEKRWQLWMSAPYLRQMLFASHFRCLFERPEG